MAVRWSEIRIAVAVCVLCVGAVEARAQSPPTPTTRVSVASDGSQANGESTSGAISADGRFAAFDSWATNLVPGDTNNARDVFVHDLETGVTTRVSVASDGSQANANSAFGALSADGRYVAFSSFATNLGGGTYRSNDIFVHDRQTGATELVNAGPPDDDPYWSSSWLGSVAISAGGRYVAFVRGGRFIVGGPYPDIRLFSDVWLYDRETRRTERVTVGNGLSHSCSLSADGRYVAFASGASDFVPGDTNLSDDVFVHDRETGVKARVSVASDGTQADARSFSPAISADGRFVAFSSVADNLVPGDTNARADIFVHDQATGLTTRVGVTGGESPAISADGRFVVGTGQDGLVVHDRETGVITRVDVATDGTPGNGRLLSTPSISADGRHVAFNSDADNLVPGDTNGVIDIFVHDLPAASEVFHAALLFRPTPGSTLASTSIRFEWTSGSGVSLFALYVGTTGPGSYDLHASRPTSPSATVSGLPFDGRTVYVRLWSYLAGAWQYADYTYKGTTIEFVRAGLTAPAPGSTLTASGGTFEWNAGSGVSQVVLYVGTVGPGSYDIYCASQGTRLSAAVSGLPVDGRTVYVRLWSAYIGGGWQYDDYRFTAATGWARLRTPAPGSMLTSSNVTFGWTEGGEVTQIALYVGTGGAGSYDLYAAFPRTGLSAAVSGLPTDGRTIFVRLWSQLRGKWQLEDYTYQASIGSTDGAHLTIPAPGSTLASTSVTFAWTASSGVSRVALYVGTGGVGSYDLYAAFHDPGQSASVSMVAEGASALPIVGRTIYVRLWSCLGGNWQYEDYVYKATTGYSQLTTPVPRSTLTSSTATFGWTVPSGVSTVALCVGVGGFGSYDIYSAIPDTSGSATISGLPTGGETIYVRLWSYAVATGWQYGDYTYTAMK